MSHVLISVVLFVIIAVIDQLLGSSKKGQESRGWRFFVLAVLGLNLLWIIFAFLPIDPWKLYLKSTAIILYLLFTPIYIFFTHGGWSVVRWDTQTVEAGLAYLIKARFVKRANDLYSLTGKGKVLAMCLRWDKKMSRT